MKPLPVGGVWIAISHGVENINPSDTAEFVEVHAQAGRAETRAAEVFTTVKTACTASG